MTEPRPGQYWIAKDPRRLKSGKRIRVLKIEGSVVKIERLYVHGLRHRKDQLTLGGLHKHYLLLHDQESLL